MLNRLFVRRRSPLPPLVALLFALLWAASRPAAAQVSVTTYHNDNYRTGLNAAETMLTPANVNQNSFGKLFSQPVDGYVYAQPLLVPGVAIPGKGVHNVVYVATQHNSLYAFDADGASGANATPLWHVNFGPSTPTPSADLGNRYGTYADIWPEVGITGTPVIDLSTQTLYIVAFVKRNNSYFQILHALDMTTGADRPFSPLNIQASARGNAYDSVNGVIKFNPTRHLQRPGLLIQNGILYVTFGSHGDNDPYHGWVMAYTKNLTLRSVWVSTPTGNEGAIWQSGAGPAADANGFLYFETGNGTFTSGANYGDSFVRLKLDCNTPIIADYFTPYNQANLEAGDVDLGSGGLMLLPPETGSKQHPNLIVGCGKEGTIYLIDRDKMGHNRPFDNSQIVSVDPYIIGGTWSSPAYWNHNIYYEGGGDALKSFSVNGAALSAQPTANSNIYIAWPGATPSVSANGVLNGIVWVIEYTWATHAMLHAFDATNQLTELYNSNQAGNRDQPGGPVKFAVPTIANGKVFVGTQTELDVYGLLPQS